MPLYYGRTASFFSDLAGMNHDEAEAAVEALAAEFEAQKGRFISTW